MPDDSSGIYSLPAGTIVSTGDTILPSQHNPWANDNANAMSNRFSKDGRAPATGNWNLNNFRITGLGAPVASGDAVTKNYADQNASKYLLKTANYTAVLADNNAAIRFTSTATLSLTAAATLGSGWRVSVIADGAPVTIDPNASETINGLLTLNVADGASCTIICDGINFYTVIKPAVWEPVGVNGGVYVLSAASSLDVTGLAAYKKLRIAGSLAPSVASQILMLTSSNNGSSYDNAASDYNYQYLTAQNTTVGGAAANSNAIQLSATATVNTTASEALNFTINVENFNKAIFANFDIRANAVNASGAFVTSVGARRNQLTARNAIRFIAASGTLTGSVTIEGQRG